MRMWPLEEVRNVQGDIQSHWQILYHPYEGLESKINIHNGGQLLCGASIWRICKNLNRGRNLHGSNISSFMKVYHQITKKNFSVRVHTWGVACLQYGNCFKPLQGIEASHYRLEASLALHSNARS